MRRKPWFAAVAFALVAGAALMFVNPKALTGEAGGAGCAVDDFADAELAKQEGHYLVMEVMVALALGIEQGNGYLEMTQDFGDNPVAMNDPIALSNSNQNNCYQTEITDSTVTGAVIKIDFGNCTDEKGRIEVAVAAQYPQGTDLSALEGLLNGGGDIPSEIPADFDPENPGDLPAEIPEDIPEDVDPEDFVPDAVSYDLTMYDTESYGVLLEGLLGYTQPTEEGAPQGIRTDLSFDFLDYAGTLTTQGTMTVDGDTSVLDFTGAFRSVGGLDWNVDARGLGVNADCKGLLSGELVATYSNPAIEHLEVVATFDGSCDGCAHVTIDGREVSDICIPEALGF
jgi:hypothetical protein